MTDFSREVDATVAGALNPGERVLWTGHCLSRLGKQRYEHRTSFMGTLLGWPISILFAGSGLWNLLGGFTNGPVGRVIGGAILLAIGVSVMYVLIIGLFRDSKMFCRKQTAYVLTDQRAFVLRHCRTEVPMRSVAWRFVDDVRAEWVDLDGRGTVKFRHWDPATRQWDTPLQFTRVGNAHRVAEWGQAAMTQANG